MSKSVGPILAVGGITMLNQTILHGQPIDWRVPVATGFAAGAFALLEKPLPTLTVGAAWVALLAVLLTRIDGKTPSPTETLLAYWNKGR